MEREKEFISSLMIAVSNCALYSRGHEAFDDLAKNALSILNECLKEGTSDYLELMIVDKELIVNKIPRNKWLHSAGLVKRLLNKGISRIDIHRGITLSEMQELITGISKPGKGLNPMTHVIIGAVDVAMAVKKAENSEQDSPTYGEEVKLKDIFHSASPFRQLNLVGLEEIVTQFVTTLRNEASILKLLCPLKSFDEYTYTHAANVSVLSIFQAETLGFDEELQHEIGISALLHDVGKLFVSKDIIDKKGKLDDSEFAEIKKHPLLGVRYLAKIPNLTRLASIIAFEHHMKYNGSGYPALFVQKRKHHIFSQIVAIADFFDALRSNRPYRLGMGIQEICTLMRQGAEKDFNPFLVDNFIRSLHNAIAL